MANFARVREHLEARGFTVSCFATAAEACDYLDRTLDGESIGIGGSVTIRDMGLAERLGTHNRIVWHWAGGTAQEASETQIYLSSVNGLAETGEIINIDGTGNRVAPASTATKRSISSWGGTSWPPITTRPSGGPGILPGPKMPSASRKKRPALSRATSAMTARAQSAFAARW